MTGCSPMPRPPVLIPIASRDWRFRGLDCALSVILKWLSYHWPQNMMRLPCEYDGGWSGAEISEYIIFWERPRGCRLSERLTIIYIEINWSIWLIYNWKWSHVNRDFLAAIVLTMQVAFCWDRQMRRPFQCLYQSTIYSEGVSIYSRSKWKSK